MYSKKFLYNSVFNSAFRPNQNPNLNVKTACSDQYMIKCFCTLRNTSLNELSETMRNFVTKVLNKNGKLFELVSKRLQLSSKLKDHSTIIIRAWTRQCEYVVAQRFRRTQQMFCLYSRLWEERALRELLKKMQQQVSKRSKELVFGAIGVTAFNFDTDKIPNEDLEKHARDFDYVVNLARETIYCKKCKTRRIVDIMLPDQNYCKCPAAMNTNAYVHDRWVPFLERKNLVVWRREHGQGQCYEYKLYGSYDDVTAADFLQVQVDIDYRQKWDTTAVSLYVVDSDENSKSDVIYWEMQWPRMFSNRDYVFNRRYSIDEQNKILTIISRSIQHPSCPVKPDKIRITDYESCMVIRPKTEVNKPGIEFCLTYYDDPGINIPAAVTSWVAIAGMPDFLNKQRNAAKEYSEYQKNIPQNTSTEGEEINIEEQEPPCTKFSPSDEEVIHQMSTPEPESRSFWRYIHPYYYLG